MFNKALKALGTSASDSSALPPLYRDHLRNRSGRAYYSSVGHLPNIRTISNPSSSTNSWHAPKRNNSITDNNERSISMVSNRVHGNGIDYDQHKKHELNNNSIHVSKMPKIASSQNMSKARSEGNLSDDRENIPANYDDIPIKPAKTGQYFDEYSYQYNSTTPFGDPPKKSISHHTLPITNGNSLKNSNSQSFKKPHAFLRSGTTRVKPTSATKQTQPLTNNNRMNGSAKINGNGSAAIQAGTIQSALRKLENDDWQEKVNALNMISALSSSNPQQVTNNISEVVAAILNECKNLRSSVSRVALVCAGTLCQNMRSKLPDGDVEKICNCLMQKAGDVSSAFIRDDATEALEKMVQHCNPAKVLPSLITAGSKAKNNTIRASCAQFLGTLVDRIGSANVLNSHEMLSKLIPALIAFSKDQTPHVRQNGRQILVNMNEDHNFDRLMKKNVSDAQYRAVYDILGHIERKGGIDALDSTSISLSGSLSRTGSVKKIVPRKLPENLQLDFDEIRNDLGASGWERRIAALRRFEEVCSQTPRAVATDTKLIEAFIGRLNDINSKVALDAMETHLLTLPAMSKYYSTEANLKAVLNQLVFALMSHLPSKSEEHRQLAQTCLMENVKQIDPAGLSPSICSATRKANVKQKPFMLTLFTRLNIILYQSRPKQMELVALPILWETLKNGLTDSDIKKATGEYARGLAKLLGERYLLEQSTTEVDPQRKKILEGLLR